MTNKEQVLKFYPAAYCIHNASNQYWKIMDVEHWIGTSFESEDKAWEWALLRANHKMMNAFKS